MYEYIYFFQKKLNLSGFILMSIAIASCFVIFNQFQSVNASIGYFEHYGWPTYGIVKPFWMTPFSAFPSRAISGYSRKHPMYNGRGLLRFKDY